MRTSVDRSFQGAFRTVLAADMVSFAAALVLCLLAVGTVRGFAFFLGLSTLLDVFTTYFFTRPLVIMLGRNAGHRGPRHRDRPGAGRRVGGPVMTITDDDPRRRAPPGKRPNAFVRLYRGETSFDFVGRRRRWYLISGIDHRGRAGVHRGQGLQLRHRLQGRAVVGGAPPTVPRRQRACQNAVAAPA